MHTVKVGNEERLSCSGMNLHHDFVVHFLAFVRQRVEADIKLRNEVNQRVDSSFGLEEFINNNHALGLQDTIATLEVTAFVPDHITGFFGDAFDFV